MPGKNIKKKKTKTKNKKIKVGAVGNNHKAVSQYKSKKMKVSKPSNLSHSPSLYEVVRNSTMRRNVASSVKKTTKKNTPERLKLLKAAISKAKENHNKQVKLQKERENANARIKSLEEFRKLMMGNV
jgi:hypothetical protein